jgi:hypothetical protein
MQLKTIMPTTIPGATSPADASTRRPPHYRYTYMSVVPYKPLANSMSELQAVLAQIHKS